MTTRTRTSSSIFLAEAHAQLNQLCDLFHEEGNASSLSREHVTLGDAMEMDELAQTIGITQSQIENSQEFSKSDQN